MLSLFLKVVKHSKTVEDIVAELQSGKGDQEAFISKYRPFILKAVSSVSKKYITEHDDEYSIGLFAFHQAIEQYSYKKGKSFFAFAELLIKRDVIDFIRKEVRHNLVFLKEEQQEDDVFEMKMSLTEYLQEIENESRKEEILHFEKMLSQFHITLSELVKESPKHRDTREHIMRVVKIVLNEENMINELFKKKKLPLKQLEEKVEVSRKTLERHRKYIIAMCIIFMNDYLYIKEYIKGVLSGE
ncbi:RNA polymerase sigma-I factor [Microbacteriaceae bacterium 4G12]